MKFCFRWADQCTFGHDSSQDREVSRFKVGQNVYIASSTNDAPINVKKAVDGWYEEVKLFNNQIINRYQ